MADNETPTTSGSLDFQDYEEFANPLTLRIYGKKYVIPEADVQKAKMALDFQRDPSTLPEELRNDNQAMWRWVLTDEVYDQMIANKVPAPAVDRAALCALYDITQGRGAALVMWKVGRDPEALAALTRAANRLTAGSDADAESAPKSPASRNGSSTSRAAKSTTTRKRTARSGARSSATGDSSARTSSASTRTASRQRTSGAGSAP